MKNLIEWIKVPEIPFSVLELQEWLVEQVRKAFCTARNLVLIAILGVLLGCSSNRISVYERYPAEWGIKGTRFLKLDSEVSLRTSVGTERRLTIAVSNDQQSIPLLNPRIYLKIPVEFSVRKTTVWRYASSNERYHTYYAEFDNVVYNDEIRGPDESFFVEFPMTGKYRFEFLVQGIRSGKIAKSEGSFMVEVF